MGLARLYKQQPDLPWYHGRVLLLLYGDNGKENGNYYIIVGCISRKLGNDKWCIIGIMKEKFFSAHVFGSLLRGARLRFEAWAGISTLLFSS